jgi:hypothetical protein
MNQVVALLLVLLLALSGYTAGRFHGQFSYRHGYRFGYRQGYFDGDRASWSRRRRELQVVVASVLSAPGEQRNSALVGPPLGGTMYASDVTADDPEPDADDDAEPATARSAGRHAVVGPAHA